ncbi:MAG: hypothetical protein UW47_C0008G0034 [Candidatus Woesebacteria bacterium GW2011_GWA1_44_23]|uniref:Uncharacterized protein n=1 Tax=Candidatus Woesebacteria bacterium GW2011_GWA1_44_23 TaxID=1618558 RepID=A0A837IJT8_9BACT|nr:MAG: hypothetical protein UW47_C0008G0034 [Candidatus Woesebacteria bacterium GW2011_GWA1_44_23]
MRTSHWLLFLIAIPFILLFAFSLFNAMVRDVFNYVSHLDLGMAYTSCCGGLFTVWFLLLAVWLMINRLRHL